MENIYADIAKRSEGTIMIGVVGPVRTGKSTFIKRFMDLLVIPNIANVYSRDRARDELPQSGAGKTIMTTEPKFIPNEAVEICLSDNAKMNVRMIDCVGYIVNSASGHIEDDMPRMVKTPWSDEEMPFAQAAEIGTGKVIKEHSTIGLVVTTDGGITDIAREDYIEAEDRVIEELKEINKPFVVLLNCVNPYSYEALKVKSEIEKKHSVSVVSVNCAELDASDINLGDGSIVCDILIDDELFYKILGENSGFEIKGKETLMSLLTELAQTKKEYDKIEGALSQVKELGYGIVAPTIDELSLEEPEIVRQGSRYGVRLKASAPSIYIMCNKLKSLEAA